MLADRLLCIRVHHGPQVGVLGGTRSNAKLMYSLGDQITNLRGNTFLHDKSAGRSATLARLAESPRHNGRDSEVKVCIIHDDRSILSAHLGLDSHTAAGKLTLDVFTNCTGTGKRHGFQLVEFKQRIPNDRTPTRDSTQHTGWEP